MALPSQNSRILEVKDLSPHIRELVIQPLESPILFKAGQWVSLKLPVGQNPPLTRAYSMARPAGESGELNLVFDRVDQGQGSHYLYSLKEGDVLSVSGPYGRFQVAEEERRDLVLVGRFTGIVPLRCIILDLLQKKYPCGIFLTYSAPSEEDMIYHLEFSDLAVSMPKFKYYPMVSPNSENLSREATRHIEYFDSLLRARCEFLPMICGIRAFVEPIRQYLKEAGFDRKSIRHEIYD